MVAAEKTMCRLQAAKEKNLIAKLPAMSRDSTCVLAYKRRLVSPSCRTFAHSDDALHNLFHRTAVLSYIRLKIARAGSFGHFFPLAEESIILVSSPIGIICNVFNQPRARLVVL